MPTELTRRLAQSREGEAITLQILRNGRAQDVVVRSGVRPSEPIRS